MTTSAERILVWDWTVRLIHWVMVILVPLLWWTAEEGHMDWHKRLGLTMFGVVVFRLIWGIVGTWTARFAPMVRRLGSLPSHVGQLRGRNFRPTFGHNPLAVLSVFALLFALVTQITTGLFSVDVDGLESGPLAVLVSFDTGRQLAEIHEFNFNVVATLIGLHIIAIAIYRIILKEQLIGPMVTGRRPRADFSATQLPDNRLRLLPLILAAALTLASIAAVTGFGWR